MKINRNDKVIGKSKAMLNWTGVVTSVTGTGAKRKYVVSFDNGSTQEVFKRSIAKHGQQPTLTASSTTTTTTINFALVGNDENESNDDISTENSSSNASDNNDDEFMSV